MARPDPEARQAQTGDLLGGLASRACPVCGSTDLHRVWCSQRIEPAQLTGMSYASRKEPEFMRLRMVVCPVCAVLYAPQVPSRQFLAAAYAEAGYDSDAEATYAAASYAGALAERLDGLPDRASALELGCGNGALLTRLRALGFESVVGIEPSREAVLAAPPGVRELIRVEAFDAGRFRPASFTLVVANQMLEHVDDPCAVLRGASRLLKPGGAMMIVSHNYRHWLMRLLGTRSPIIDVEHLQIFSPASLRYALARTGFEAVRIASFRNRYPLRYWLRLLPVPRGIKAPLLQWLRTAGDLPIEAGVGNMLAWASVARRPA